MVICQPIGVVLCGKLSSTAVNSGYDRGHSWSTMLQSRPTFYIKPNPTCWMIQILELNLNTKNFRFSESWEILNYLIHLRWFNITMVQLHISIMFELQWLKFNYLKWNSSSVDSFKRNSRANVFGKNWKRKVRILVPKLKKQNLWNLNPQISQKVKWYT